MRCFWDERQRAHAPTAEFFNGRLHRSVETPGRPDAILAAIGRTQAPGDQGMEPLRRAHSGDYLQFLQSAHSDWRDAGHDGDAFPYTFPAVRRRPLALERIDARLGRYGFDTASPIAEGTWQSAYWSAQTALAGMLAALDDRRAFALCRPPGHHSGADYFGGYCYLNNAAIAAEAALANGHRCVAILDVDYHHGNGTQDIFYGRRDVPIASIHADPKTDYPFFWGHSDETGEGEGAGANLNLPLPRGTKWGEYEVALDRALEWLAGFSPELLIVSFGADTWGGDPISHFQLETQDYALVARRIAAAGLPTLIVMEGGYAVDALGANVAEFLSGF
ncbi:MAG: histone deacetylase family protein [Sphingomicrobium sp.]